MWAVAAVLAVASFVIFLFNYRTLEKVTVFSEKNAVNQAQNFRYYVNEYKVAKVALDEANQKIVTLTQELDAANQALSLTRDELSSLQQTNDQLKVSIAGLERYKAKAAEKGEALESMIQAFKQKNRDLDRELQGVRKELATFLPDINDINEGRSKIKMFKEHIQMVKQNMSGIREKAFEAKVAAQKERDRLETLYGNGGYMVKDGQDKSVKRADQPKVQIDVNFINK